MKEAHDKDKEDGRENSESSDDERFVLPYNEELSSPGILKESGKGLWTYQTVKERFL